MEKKITKNQLELDLFGRDTNETSTREKEKEKEKESIIKDIKSEVDSIIITIQNEMMYLSGIQEVYDIGNYDKIKKISESLRNKNNHVEANRLMRFMGALKRAKNCRRMLREGNLNDFSKYIKDLPKASGSSCMVILELSQYDKILDGLKRLEKFSVLAL